MMGTRLASWNSAPSIDQSGLLSKQVHHAAAEEPWVVSRKTHSYATITVTGVIVFSTLSGPARPSRPWPPLIQKREPAGGRSAGWRPLQQCRDPQRLIVTASCHFDDALTKTWSTRSSFFPHALLPSVRFASRVSLYSRFVSRPAIDELSQLASRWSSWFFSSVADSRRVPSFWVTFRFGSVVRQRRGQVARVKHWDWNAVITDRGSRCRGRSRPANGRLFGAREPQLRVYNRTTADGSPRRDPQPDNRRFRVESREIR